MSNLPNDFKNGLSRRNFMRTLGAASVAATTFPAFAAIQQAAAVAPPAPGQQERRRGAGGDGNGGDFGERVIDPLAVVISSNENPLGPSPAAREAIAKVGAEGGRYHREYQQEVVKTFSDQMSLKPGYVQLYPGSGGALDLAVYSSLLNGKDLVVGEPSYEQAPSAGAKMKVAVHRIPLLPNGAYDIDAMLAASPNIGAFYVCNPNNPTGTMTPKSEIVRLVKNKPAGSVVIVDEAYHHFSNDESSIDLVGAEQDVIVLRTFSKVYGMAGLRAGFLIAKPELQAKVRLIGTAAGTGSGSGAVSIATAGAATASIKDAALIPARRKINKDIRENVLEWMDKNGYSYYKGSQANFFQVDVKRPGKEFAALMTKEHIHIGRTWAAMPNYSRITVGTQEEMDKFKVAFKKCYEMPPLSASAYLHLPDHYSELDFARAV
jgi:histidinol-phosphate aminotransferase